MDDTYSRLLLTEQETDAVNALLAEISTLRSEVESLSDPAAVHINILRGTIKLRREDALHIAGATDYDSLRSEVAELREALDAARREVDLQADDDGLWFKPVYASEAYLQRALRKLHEIVEGKTAAECAAAVLAKHKGYVAASPPDTHDEG